ncbi:hypothetical protein CO019_00190 [Candidatus Berkelbacteria bacterium CG_4_9_14_0_2_um_filter_42_30]|uniref:TrpR like protein, YerC/YecD n=5 Tax=Candidatus Berkelbacteria TaxID=1618330 RepID=A0A2M7K1B9_9BACT|nr:helix-turn-helix domain-containing protein [bacterium]PIP51154.1 MAG: hypothetical protein COX11_00025 [Candidatus Berkelbacteria bacterium CG23_combo_of_CG06-09_8_20_14_all_41_73]PIR27307.1 MAG: hypothetical protein COV40_01595 [Candidatus Berkelbacteria bacterium CG11_big_fil_rev_8_21_14_0_20_42_15]PIX30024.1 MAG: hypothetical protein COZ63_01925 [Candidatus Berkelbacteria bacterium CG_4_8_14_3_um_filter_42_13]PIZ27843.1 MAG: hypothetical protein COY45_00290 [Candidatus Berkelbacteria bact
MRKIANRWDAEKMDSQFGVLVKLFSECREEKEHKALLSTLLTSSEKAAIAQRLEIIRRLKKGEIYADICLAMGVSSTTITRSLDLYHKNGEHNATFNKLLMDFKYEPRQPKIKSTYRDPQQQNTAGGVREFLRQEARIKKKSSN